MLVVVAVFLRSHVLPRDGLWFDDAVTAAGVKASLSHLLTVGFDHPGYTAGLMGWARAIGGSDTSLAYPALIAGTLGPGLLYLALRRLGYARSIGALLAAALAASQTDIIYSGRIKTYTIDVLVVLGLALLVPRLVKVTWRWQTGLLWTVAAILVASLSSFALIAVAVAGVILAVHPRSDLRVRVPAIAVQEAAHIGFLLAGFGGQYSYSSDSLNAEWRHIWDAFVDFDPNPLRFGADALRHLTRVAEVFPGGPGGLATMCALTAVIGLAVTAWRGRQSIRARYLLLVVIVAFAGSVLGKFPFGPKQAGSLSPGGRASLWLVPAMAIGLAAVLQALRGLVIERRVMYLAIDAAVYLSALFILLIALVGQPYRYPTTGPWSASSFIQSQLTRHDVALLPWPSGTYSFAAESDFAARMDPQPEFVDPRIQNAIIGPQAMKAVRGADRVFVYLPNQLLTEVENSPGNKLATMLGGLGFVPRLVGFQDASVVVWDHGQVTPAARIDLNPRHLPPGWSDLPFAASPYSRGLFTCLHVPTPITSQSAVAVAPQANSRLTAVPEVTVWSSPGALQKAFDALNRRDARRCIQSTLQSLMMKAGYPSLVSASPVPGPSVAGNRVLAYTATVKTASGTSQLAQGTAVFFAHGTTGVLISGISSGTQPFPSPLLWSLAEILAGNASQ